MKVLVLGAGVVGVTTAWRLAQEGAEVTIIDRHPDVAMETSFANAGQVSPGYAAPWAAPGVPMKALKWLFQRHAPLSIRPDGTAFQWQWLLQMLRNCSAKRYAVNKSRMVALAEYSRDCLQGLRQRVHLPYEGRTLGTLQVFRSEAQMAATQRDIAVLQDAGVPFELLQSEELSLVEPGLARAQSRLTGGLRLPSDETGDCHLFTRARARHALGLGVQMRMGCTVKRWLERQGQVCGVVLDDPDQNPIEADRIVLAGGVWSRELLNPLGISVPIYPVKGHSITLPIVDEGMAPVSTVLDETYKVAVTRFDRRVSRRRPVTRTAVEWAAPHDPRRHPADLCNPAPSSVAQHGPRHLGLDDGLWLSRGALRPDDGKEACGGSARLVARSLLHQLTTGEGSLPESETREA
jgi:D-amino-acid dehydrogenase